MERAYETLRILRSGGTIDLEGIKLKAVMGDMGPGDLYVAERNTGPVLLTVKEIKNDIVFPTCDGYAFDRHECVKVREDL